MAAPRNLATTVLSVCLATLLLGTCLLPQPEAEANDAIGEASVVSVCWYPRYLGQGRGYHGLGFLLNARVEKAKTVTFFWHGHPQRGIAGGKNFATNFAFSRAGYQRSQTKKTVGSITMRVQLRSGKRFSYRTSPAPCLLG